MIFWQQHCIQKLHPNCGIHKTNCTSGKIYNFDYWENATKKQEMEGGGMRSFCALTDHLERLSETGLSASFPINILACSDY